MMSVQLPTLEQRIALQNRPVDLRQVMVQSWQELLFIHWSIDPEEIQRTLPPQLTVDTYQGRAWLGIVPFYMRGIRPVYLPPVPGISNFLEVNVRTYVHLADGTPGVWFYSLDANQWLAVRVARRFFHLPYFDAQMEAPKLPLQETQPITYRSQRRDTPADLSTTFTFRAGTERGPAQPGTFEFFLIERYLLFAYDAKRQQLFQGQVYHTPYELCDVEVTEYDDHLLQLAGFNLDSRPAEHKIMSHGVTVDVFPVQRIG